MYKNLFIDLDDTLWDTFNNNKESLEEVYNEFNFESYYTSFEVFFDIYYRKNVTLWDQYRDGKIDKATLTVERFIHLLEPTDDVSTTRALTINESFLKRSSSKTGLIPGAIELLNYLKPKYRMSILSNGFREVQSKKIFNAGLADYFSHTILSEDAGVNKPHPDIFHYALLETSFQKEETLMIGDSWEADIIGAHNAGMHQLWFNPYEIEQQAFKPTHIVKSLLEIKAIL